MRVRLAGHLGFEPFVDAIRHALAGTWAALARRLRRLSREQVLWGVMAILLLLFVLVLVTQPTSVGRGGR